MRTLCVVVTVLALAGVGITQSPDSAASAPETVTLPIALPITSAATINSGDLLDITVFGVPELSMKSRVASNGSLYLPLLNYVQIKGKTVDEAQQLVEAGLRTGGFLREPHVTIFVVESALNVSVMGEVTRSGVFPYASSRRLFDALSQAGGIGPNAGNIISVAHASQPDVPILISVSSDPSKTSLSNVVLQPGDTVIVSKANQVYVVGEVVHPSNFSIYQDRPLTVLQVLAMANGATATASLSKAKILRRDADGIKQIPVNIGNIMTAKRSDVPLSPNDILFVPTNRAKQVMKRGADAVLQVGTGVAILSVPR